MDHRRFIAMSGASIPVVWIPGTGMFQIPRSVLVAMVGECTFCDRQGDEVFGAVGVTGSQERICDACVRVCRDVLPETPRERNLHPEMSDLIYSKWTHKKGHPFEVAMKDLVARTSGGQCVGDCLMDELADVLESLRRKAGSPAAASADGGLWSSEQSCAFCGISRNQANKLIAGPDLFICDGCIEDAAGLFTRHGWSAPPP